ncbi:MAG: hypothetical protein GY820_35595, partial [Gammaproteobacteria bacterium]|nr:hypothetical protein [Gammaproteobacteria bacterium]
GQFSTEAFPVETNGYKGKQGQRQWQKKPAENSAKREPIQGPFVNSQRKAPSCIFCKQPHYSDECIKYADVQTRRKRLFELNRCYKCLKEGHGSRTCDSPQRTCFHCKKMGLHPRALCPNVFQVDSRTNQKNVTHVKVVKTSEFGKPNSEESSSAEQEIGVGIITAKPKETAQVASGGSYLLIADVYSRMREQSTPKQVKFKVFLDNGSQKSFITKRLAEQLNLAHEKVEVLSISTFNQRSPQVVESPVVTMELLLKNGEKFPMTLNVMPSLTGPMRR